MKEVNIMVMAILCILGTLAGLISLSAVRAASLADRDAEHFIEVNV